MNESESASPSSLPAQVVRVPIIPASAFQAHWTDSECLVVLGRPLISASIERIESPTSAGFDPVAILNLSPQSAKNLCLVLESGIRKYESVWGTILTEYSKEHKKMDNVLPEGAEDYTRIRKIPAHKFQPTENKPAEQVV